MFPSAGPSGAFRMTTTVAFSGEHAAIHHPALIAATLPGPQVRARSLLVAQSLAVGKLEQTDLLARSPTTVRVGEESYAVLFRYGVVVTFGVGPLDELALLEKLRPLAEGPLPTTGVEEIDILVGLDGPEQLRDGVVTVRRLTVQHMQLLAEVLAKSVILAHYEQKLAATFDLIAPVAEHLRAKGTRGVDSRELIRHVGTVLLDEQTMIGRAEVVEKPETLWDHPELDRFYTRVEDEFDIRERSQAIGRKLELIHRTAETILRLVESSHTLRVEWYIVVLIVIEIGLTLVEMAFFLNH